MSRPVAVVTGAGSGIGAACADALAASGSDTVLVGRRAEALERTAAAVRAAGADALVLARDVTEPEVEDVVTAAIDHFGRLDIVVTAAGSYEAGAAGELSEAHVRWLSQLLWTSPMLLADAAVRAFRTTGRPGRIVHVSSITALSSRGGYTAYESAKAALIASARSMAIELAPEGIAVNTVAPGWIRSEMTEPTLAAATPAEIAGLIPAGRAGEAAEIAEVVRWLALEAPGFLTAQTIVVDGGQLARTGALHGAPNAD
jgi:NAD(P)-dependent dehydrogenase (short-subunit alcohol dehydrogenase family)